MDIIIKGLTKRHSNQQRPALDRLNAQLPAGKISGIVGPDGAGKTTLLRLLAGLLSPDEGSCHILGKECLLQREELLPFMSYLPQRSGLYEDLTVAEMVSLIIELQGIDLASIDLHHLLTIAELAPFVDRLIADLSGGMKQKLALLCAILKKPKILLLDEPTVGVDPLSRRELWRMIEMFKDESVTIVWSTSDQKEAERCDHLLLLHDGKPLFQGTPELFKERWAGRVFLLTDIKSSKGELLDTLMEGETFLDAMIQGEGIRVVVREDRSLPSMEKVGSVQKLPPTVEDGFIALLGGITAHRKIQLSKKITLPQRLRPEATIAVSHLTKRFGSFTAVDDVSFNVAQGEIFGLIGPNGAGKSTIFKLLLGLLTPTQGESYISEISMAKAPSLARTKIGYMAQKFSLYDNMTVIQNLRFFAGVYSVPTGKMDKTLDKMIELFELTPLLNQLSATLSLGSKQRLALSCSLLHEPEVLFLDEPTSGVDPLTRREFWHHISTLSQQGVTILVSTHFMEEAEHCDRIGFINRGTLRALDTPDQIKAGVRTALLPHPTMEDAFIQLSLQRRHE